MSEKVFFSRAHSEDSNRILYTPSEFAKMSLMYLQEVGSLTATKQHISRRDSLKSYLCFIVMDGSGSITYDGEKYSLNKGDVVFIDCMKPYFHESSNNLWTLKWCHFCGLNMPVIYGQYLELGGLVAFSPKNGKLIAKCIDDIYEHALNDDYMVDIRINQALATLVTFLMEEAWHPENRVTVKKIKEIADVKKYIDDNYKEKMSIEDLAERFYVDRAYMSRIFKKTYGTTIIRYINVTRINKAKSMLRFSEDTVEDIAAKVGIEDANYFTRTFKKIEGITPGEYRKKW